MRYLKDWLMFVVMCNMAVMFALCFVQDIPPYSYLIGLVLGTLGFITRLVCHVISRVLAWIFEYDTDEI